MRLVILTVSILAFGFGCRPQVVEQECVPAEVPAAAAPASVSPATGVTSRVERTSLSKASQSRGEWCQGCVLSREHFISCQKEYAQSDSEGREELRRRAKDSACKDAGYSASECPGAAVLALVCKGEKLSPDLFNKAGESFKFLKQGAQSAATVPPGSAPAQQQPNLAAPAAVEK